ncbi:MAG: hypothetical protein RR816_07230, partial [Clostridia bacterium]
CGERAESVRRACGKTCGGRAENAPRHVEGTNANWSDTIYGVHTEDGGSHQDRLCQQTIYKPRDLLARLFCACGVSGMLEKLYGIGL